MDHPWWLITELGKGPCLAELDALYKIRMTIHVKLAGK
jgi:hypothetical protein